jgi:hypothetical protein
MRRICGPCADVFGALRYRWFRAAWLRIRITGNAEYAASRFLVTLLSSSSLPSSRKEALLDFRTLRHSGMIPNTIGA